MLLALFHYFSLTIYKKIYLLQQLNVTVRGFSSSLSCGDCMPEFHVRVCEAIISVFVRWELEEFKATCKLVLNHFFKP